MKRFKIVLGDGAVTAWTETLAEAKAVARALSSAFPNSETFVFEPVMAAGVLSWMGFIPDQRLRFHTVWKPGP